MAKARKKAGKKAAGKKGRKRAAKKPRAGAAKKGTKKKAARKKSAKKETTRKSARKETTPAPTRPEGAPRGGDRKPSAVAVATPGPSAAGSFPYPSAALAAPRISTVSVNRAPVLTLWAAVVAERMGYDRDAALTFGKAVAGLNAQSKGRRLGIYGPPKGPERGGPPKKVGLGEEFWVEVCGRPVPGKRTADGIRAVVLDKPIDPWAVKRYLAGKFGDSLEAAREAMTELARAYEPERLVNVAYGLYTDFRPRIEPGVRGWGQKGVLDLVHVRNLARRGG